ncbi:hypothetical protein ACFLQV_05195 [Calditrichota bacterium]
MFFTLAVARYQRMTGPTYPVDGMSTIGGNSFKYELTRTHDTGKDQLVEVIFPDNEVSGKVLWKRYKFDEAPHLLSMKRHGDTLRTHLPSQPPAGKLEYQLRFTNGNETITIPDEPVITRFKGHVPMRVLLPHILFMFAGLMLSARTALGAILNGRIQTLAWITLGLLTVGGLILGPVVQKYAFDAYWTGWPFGEDLTDNKTAVMVIVWLIALWIMRGKAGDSRGRWWAVAAMVVTFAVYLIPHSMRGSELDYSNIAIDTVKTQSDSLLPTSSDDSVSP